MNTRAYLDRIGYERWPDPTRASLSALHYQHLLTVPLENLAIHAGIPLVLASDALYEKIVTQRRGGICYELNGLFFDVLQAVGFATKRLSGRTYTPEGTRNSEFDHLALLARIEAMDYLVDVGLGRRFPLHPLRLVVDQIQEDRTGAYRITQPGAATYLLSRRTETGTWERVYTFTRTAQAMSAFEAMCRYHQTSADSFFTRTKICSRLTQGGRITLSATYLRRSEQGQLVEERIGSEQAFEVLLMSHFGMSPYRKLI